MKFVHIYGPPAAGKYTVGTELARRTGMKLFHNHLSIAAVEPVFEFGSEVFWRIVGQLRDSVIGAAAEEGIDLIFTQVYDHPVDLPKNEQRFESVEARGGEVCLVQLVCSLDDQRARMSSPSRAALHKLTDFEVFRASLEEHKDVFSPMPGRPSLLIDTSTSSPEEAAERIIRHYSLEETTA